MSGKQPVYNLYITIKIGGIAMAKKKQFSIETTLKFSTLINAKNKEEAMELAIESFANEYRIDVDEDECKISEL